jgi:hypothetical protein
MAETRHIARGRVSVSFRRPKTGDCFYAWFKIEQCRLAHGQRHIAKTLKPHTWSVAGFTAPMS